MSDSSILFTPIRAGSLLLPHRVVTPMMRNRAGAGNLPTELMARYEQRASHDLIVINGGFDRETATAAIERNEADLVAFGVPFLANPDLPARLRRAARLNAPVRATLYGGDGRGYTDYPALQDPSVLMDIPSAVSH